jgi:hypothetical protein
MRCATLIVLLSVTVAAEDKRNLVLQQAAKLANFEGQQMPPATPETMRKAQDIASGTVLFYDHTPVKIGLSGIDWSGGHIHHVEWPADLNRFFYLRELAAAYKASREERYAHAARAYIEDWIRGEHYDRATSYQPGDRSLDMSIRLGNSVESGWGGTLPAFLDSNAFDDSFLDIVFASIDRQAVFLASHMSATENNWRISELDSLVFTALRFPFLPHASKLLDAGVAGMRIALGAQFLSDGVHIERTPDYALWMTRVLADYYELERLLPEVKTGVDVRRLALALDYAAQTDLCALNDSTAPHRDPAQLPGLAFRAEKIHRLKLGAPELPPLEQIFPAAGQIFVRSDWKPGADYLAFDASTWGGGHSHLSRLSFLFRSGGRMLVADPGILDYEVSNPLMSYGKSTPAHSTLNIGGLNQSGADAQLLHTAFTPDVALIHARYEGAYWPGRYDWRFGKRGAGAYGDHERVLLWIMGEYVLVLDSMSADPGSEVRNVWQFGPMERWSQDVTALSWWSENGDRNLFLQLVLPPHKAVMQCFQGSREPPRGWVGLHGDDAVAAPLAEFRYPVESARAVVSAVLLVPFSGTNRPRYTVDGDADLSKGIIHHLKIHLPDGYEDSVAWTDGLALPVEDGKPLTTDAALVWLRRDSAGKELKRFLLGGAR